MAKTYDILSTYPEPDKTSNTNAKEQLNYIRACNERVKEVLSEMSWHLNRKPGPATIAELQAIHTQLTQANRLDSDAIDRLSDVISAK